MRILVPVPTAAAEEQNTGLSEASTSQVSSPTEDKEQAHQEGASTELESCLLASTSSSNPNESESSFAIQKHSTPGVKTAREQKQSLPAGHHNNQRGSRKRDFIRVPSQSIPRKGHPSSETQKLVSKRPRVESRNLGSGNGSDSKFPARTMTAPKDQPDDDREDFSSGENHSDTTWEENEPAPLRNQNYYKNHPSNNAHLTSAGSSAVGVASAQPKNYDHPISEEEEDFMVALKGIGLEIVEQDGDGNCLFRAVSLQIYGGPDCHAEIREQCLNFMAVNEEHFGQFITDEPFQSYIARKRNLGVHGNNPEIQAISELFNRPIQVFTPRTGAKPLNIFHKEYGTADVPIRLSYHDGNHYNAVIDPSTPTAGLGLGLPGLQPGLADKLQVAAATAESDVQNDLDQAIEASKLDHSKYNDDQLQRVLKESSYSVDSMHKNKAIGLSDLEQTNWELEQAVLETSLQTFHSHDEGRKQRASPTDRRRKQSPLTVASPSHSKSIPAAAASAPLYSVAAAAAAPSPASPPHSSSSAPADTDQFSADQYPAVVQELVMNGFQLERVIHAYELIGENFDDILTFLMSNPPS
mmetsp:Transcript_30692/g.64094  ORF Transcript_30692/g.64094 Transcript_30692/m.64094 type:complete len:582 (-) Transcript_30692:2293-4038(-)